MTIASKLIQAGYREGNLIPAGKQPTVDEQAEALDRLNAYIAGVYGYEMGEPLLDWNAPAPQRTAPVAANYPQLPYPQGLDASLLTTPFAYDPDQDVYLYPPKNSRVVFGSQTLKLFFPEAPDDGSRMGIVQGSGAGDGGMAGTTITLDGNGRTIGGADTLVLTAPVTPAEWLYRADLGDWVLVADMELTDECPFPKKFDDLWICMLAIRLASRYSKTTGPGTEATAIAMMKKLKAQYRQHGTTTYGSADFPRSLQSYISGRWFWAIPIALVLVAHGAV